MHYGEAWYKQREALERDKQEEREALDPTERKKKSLKAAKRYRILGEMELQRDKGMLAEGKTWHGIMVWPAEPSNVLPLVEMSSDAVSSPFSSSSGHSDHSGPSTYPPTPNDFRREAMDGPQMTSDQKEKGEGNWDQLEWGAVQSRLSEAQYKERKIEMVAAIRSGREDNEYERRNDVERAAIADLKLVVGGDLWTDQGRHYIEKEKRERRMRDLDLRQKGWTQEQVDAMDREKTVAEAAAWEQYNERLLKEPPTNNIGSRPMTQEKFDAKNRAWDTLGLSKERQAELVRMFGLNPEPEPGIADAPASERVSQPRASSPRPAKDTSRRTRGGRITKNAAQGQSVASGGTRSR